MSDLSQNQRDYCDRMGWRADNPRPLPFVVMHMICRRSIEDRIAEEDAIEEARNGGQFGLGA